MMNKKEIFKKVGGIITELNEQYEYLSQSPENLNELELELFSANANFLSDHIAILVKLNENSKQATQDNLKTGSEPEGAVNKLVVPVSEKNPSKLKEEEVNIPNWKFELEKDSDEVVDSDEKGSDKLFNLPLTEEEVKVIEQQTRLKSEPEEERISKSEDQQSQPPVLNEPIVKEVVILERTVALPVEKTVGNQGIDNPHLTINDLLSRQYSQGTVASQFNQLQTKNLKSMISLNDKLLFVRDLFKGYSLAYSEAIELLNRFDRIEAAENFLNQNYAVKNNWADKQAVADKFYEVLGRRFSI